MHLRLNMGLNKLAEDVLEYIKVKYPFVVWEVDDHPYNRNIPLCKQFATLLIRQKSIYFCEEAFDDYFSKYELKSNKCYFMTIYFGKHISEKVTTNIIRTVLYESLHNVDSADEKTILAEFINRKFVETKFPIATCDNDYEAEINAR